MRHALIVVTAALLVSPVLAADVYTCGFETGEGYTIALLDGQQDWQAKPAVAVQDWFVGSDAQSMAIMADGSYEPGQFHWAAEQTWPPHESLSGVVTVSQEIKITHLNAADWIIEFRHPADSLFPDSPNFIAFRYDGWLYCNDLHIGYWSPDTWMTLTLIIDYVLQETTVELDGVPLAVDMAFYNPGAMFDQIIYYSDDWQPGGQANFMVIDDLRVSVPGTAGNPLISVQTTDDLDWVYQNTPGSMANNGHYCDVFVTVDFLNGNDWVSCSLEKVPVSGEGGEVTFGGGSGASGINWRVFGSMRTDATAGCGPLTLRVKGWGNIAGQAAVDFPFNVRTCGDIDGDGGVEPGDAQLLIIELNGLPNPAGIHDKAFDLDADGRRPARRRADPDEHPQRPAGAVRTICRQAS